MERPSNMVALHRGRSLAAKQNKVHDTISISANVNRYQLFYISQKNKNLKKSFFFLVLEISL